MAFPPAPGSARGPSRAAMIFDPLRASHHRLMVTVKPLLESTIRRERCSERCASAGPAGLRACRRLACSAEAFAAVLQRLLLHLAQARLQHAEHGEECAYLLALKALEQALLK